MFFAPLLGAVSLFAGAVSALPRPDSAIGQEVAVSAPNGIILSDTAELASQLASESAATATATSYPATTTAADSSFVSSYVASSSYAVATDSSYATTTSSAYVSAMTYGSGSNLWGGSGYNDCVNQCIASFGAPPSTWTPPPSTGTSTGSGALHTVIVAPKQGVFRFVPPFINANVGDTVRFVWNANNHTVTKSSRLEMCNKTIDHPFASGEQNMPFTFDQVVNDTNPVFYYCGTPTHCQKGMFGVINPGNADGSNVTVDAMMGSMLSNSSTLSAMMSYASSFNGSDAAMSWGGSVNMSSFPSWSHSYVMENVLYARALFAANSDVITPDGKVDMSAGGNPVTFPMDLASVVDSNNAASDDTSSSSSVSSADTATSSSASSTSAAPTSTNGAGHIAASSALIGIAAIAVSLLAL